MRRKVTLEALKTFMEELAAAARSPGRVYFTGGATALLLGFREQTIDVDLKFEPEPGGVFEAIAGLKNRLEINIELASPDDFIPEAPGWQERSRPIASIGAVEFFHYDFGMQVLSKLERGHAQDLADAADFLGRGLVTSEEIRLRFSQIYPHLLRYPAIDPQNFRTKVEMFLGSGK